MNKISGKIVTKETGPPISGLLVSFYEVDPSTLPEDHDTNTLLGPHGDRCGAEERSASRAATNVWAQLLQGDRLGSVLIDESGRFELAYEDTEFSLPLHPADFLRTCSEIHRRFIENSLCPANVHTRRTYDG